MPKKRRNSISFSARALIVSALLILAAVYAVGALLPVFQGPRIVLEEPRTIQGTTIIAGTTKDVSKLTLNDREIPLTEEGRFSVEHAYAEGYTVLVVRASDRFGRTTEEIITFVNNTQFHASQEKTESHEINN